MIQEIPYHQDSSRIFECIKGLPWAVFLDSGFPRNLLGRFDILSAKPCRTLTTRGSLTEIWDRSGSRHSEEDPFSLLREALSETDFEDAALPFIGGALGYFAYDLARRLENLPQVAKDLEQVPQMMVGIYDWAIVVDHGTRRSWLVQQDPDSETEALCKRLLEQIRSTGFEPWNKPFHTLGPVLSNLDREEYGDAFRRIKRYLLEGDCYQVNLAQRFSVACEGDPWSAYKRLRELNPAPFSGFLDFPGVQVLSSSPERFIRIEDGRVETKPIKGTRARSLETVIDRERIAALRTSIKDRAENLMIVDLLRNDLGKSCAPGSVRVPKLFEVESFATVHHLVSTVQGRLAIGRDGIDLLRGCFPGGSITGAPKIRAMEIIEELEPARRGIYCGSIGYIDFRGNMDTNITIRTLVHSANMIRFWAGGGIVSDSSEADEFQECLDKAAAMLKMLRGCASRGDRNRKVVKLDR